MTDLGPAERSKLAQALGSQAAADQIADIVDCVDLLSSTEAGYLDGVTAGTSAASKVLTLDANSEINSLGVVQVSDTIIATAEVKDLNANPVECVAAPGAGVYLEFLGAYVFLDYESAAYADDAGEDLVFKYTDENGDDVSMRGDGSLFDGTADALVWFPPIGASAAVGAITMVANAPIVAHILVGEWVTGDSPLKIRVYYREIRKAALEAIA